MNRRRCPDCGSRDTHRMFLRMESDVTEEGRICLSCQYEFTNIFDLVEQEETDE